MSTRYFSALALAGTFAATAGCGSGDWGHGLGGHRGHQHRALVSALNTQAEPSPAATTDAALNRFDAADNKARDLQVTPPSTAVSGTVTFHKDQLFGREFLYGMDLQYSSGTDDKLALINQSESIGHVPAFFRQVGNELQLVGDQTRLFESVVNHPELLLATYQVVAEDATTLTVKFESGGVVLNEVVNGKGVALPKQVWIRSLTFVEDGDYLLQESGLLLNDGSVQTFMESVFPRSNLVSNAGPSKEANPANEPLAARYRFLGGDNVYVAKTNESGDTVRVQTSYAAHIALKDQQTIDWYVTPNAPDNFLPVLRSGVEGWNRYFVPQLGRPVMRFMGRLPNGIKIGDPRYNVVNFDSVADAGAAYESQATDPLTGIQSHSLIYFPYAWYNIGVEFWKGRTGADNKPSVADITAAVAPKSPEVAFGTKRAVLDCVRSTDAINLTEQMLSDEAAGLTAVPVPASVDEFGKRLMMSTLFHEVGHSLGMAHNFKGSLALDTSKPLDPKANPVTWSVMDYNYYQSEQELFGPIGSSDGPLLEYDRQFISQMYHSGNEVKATDAVLPACEDGEADSTDGGVDPLCLRYDSESDPTLALLHAYHNVVSATGAAGIESKTLAEALTALVPSVTAKFSSPDKIANADALNKAATTLATQISNLVAYYVSSGAQSLRYNLVNNGKALRVWRADVAVADEAGFRGRYAQVFNDAMTWQKLPDAPAQALKAIGDALNAAAAANTAVGASADERTANATKALAAFNKVTSVSVTAALSKVRTMVYPTLAFDLKNSFTLAMAPGGALSHFEDLALTTLRAGILAGLDGDNSKIAALRAERLAAAPVYFSFHQIAGQPYGDGVDKLQALAATAQQTGNTSLLTAVREMLQVVNP